MKGFSFFSPFCRKFLQCGWKVPHVRVSGEVGALDLEAKSAPKLGGAGQVAGPPEGPLDLSGRDAARPTSLTRALRGRLASWTRSPRPGAGRVETEALAWASGSPRQSFPGRQDGSHSEVPDLAEALLSGLGSPLLHTYCVPGTLEQHVSLIPSSPHDRRGPCCLHGPRESWGFLPRREGVAGTRPEPEAV